MKFSDALVQTAITARLAPRRYPFPGIEGQFVAVKALTDTEMDGCRMRATDFVKMKKMAGAVELAVDPSFFDRALYREQVAASFRDPDALDDFYFSKADDVSQFDNVTIMALHQLFCLHQAAMDPYASVSEEEVDALVEALGKGGVGTEIWSSFDRDTLWRLALSLACKVRSMLPSPSSSTG